MKFLRVGILFTFMMLVANVATRSNPYRGMKLCRTDSDCPSDAPYCRSVEGSKAQMSYCAIESQMSRWRKCYKGNVPNWEWDLPKAILL